MFAPAQKIRSLSEEITITRISGWANRIRRIAPSHPVPQPGERKTRDFYISKLGEDEAREAAIAQRLRWEQAMERYEQTHPPKIR